MNLLRVKHTRNQCIQIKKQNYYQNPRSPWHVPNYLPSSSRVTTILTSNTLILSALKFYLKGIPQDVLICVWFLWLQCLWDSSLLLHLVIVDSLSKKHLFIFKRERGHRERDKEPQADLAEHGAWHRARAYDPEIMTWTQVKSPTLNRLSHSGAPSSFILITVRIPCINTPHFI